MLPDIYADQCNMREERILIGGSNYFKALSFRFVTLGKIMVRIRTKQVHVDSQANPIQSLGWRQ